MNKRSWKLWAKGFGIVTRVCAAFVLGVLVALSWMVRRSAEPTATVAGSIETWALDQILNIRDELMGEE